MRSSILFALAAAFHGLNAQAVDAFGITLYEKVEALERQLLDPATLNSLVTPCSVNFGDNPFRGQQTSAEWVRIVFHDVITKGIAGPGLGGLDASIQFESDREENLGIFVNVTVKQFAFFQSAFLSLADLIGVGLSDSLATCDQPPAGSNDEAPRIPLRVGRIDAAQAGPMGVPGPLDSFQFALDAFVRAGFSQGEMIQAIACGHSLGGVHHSIFPEIVPESAVDEATNADGRVGFDSSPANFDNKIITEYLDGTTQNPLVVGPVATRSDLRIFSSDGNVTMSSMVAPNQFRATCHTIFTKMINTVPNGIVLSDPVNPRPWILLKGAIDVDSSGGLLYKGVALGSGPGTRPTTTTYVYKNSGGSTIGGTKTTGNKDEFFVPQSKFGFGRIAKYPFTDPIPTTIASILVANSYTRPINNNIFISHSRSFRNELQASTGAVLRRDFTIRVAVKASLAVAGTTVKVKFWDTVPQANSLGVKNVIQETVATFKENVGAYKIYQAVMIDNTVTDGHNIVQARLYNSANTVLHESFKHDQLFDLGPCSVTPLTNC